MLITDDVGASKVQKFIFTVLEDGCEVWGTFFLLMIKIGEMPVLSEIFKRSDQH